MKKIMIFGIITVFIFVLSINLGLASHEKSINPIITDPEITINDSSNNNGPEITPIIIDKTPTPEKEKQ